MSSSWMVATITTAPGRAATNSAIRLSLVPSGKPRQRQRGHRVDPPYAGQGLRQQVGQPLARLVKVLHDQRALEQAIS